jgi:hypothetical protein
MIKEKKLANIIKNVVSNRDDVAFLGTFEKTHEIDYDRIINNNHSYSNFDRCKFQTNIYIIPKKQTTMFLRMDRWFKDVVSEISSHLSQKQKIVTSGYDYVQGGYYFEYVSRPTQFFGGEYRFILKAEEFSEYVDMIEFVSTKASSKELNIVGSVSSEELKKIKKNIHSNKKQEKIQIKLFDHVYLCPLLNKEHYERVSKYPNIYSGEMNQKQVEYYLKSFNLVDE